MIIESVPQYHTVTVALTHSRALSLSLSLSFVRSFVCSFVRCSFTSFVRSLRSLRSFVRSFVRCSFVRSFGNRRSFASFGVRSVIGVCSFVHFVWRSFGNRRLFVRSFVCSLVRLFVRFRIVAVRPSVCPSLFVLVFGLPFTLSSLCLTV